MVEGLVNIHRHGYFGGPRDLHQERQTAGDLVENLPALWEKANLSEKRKLLMTMLDGVDGIGV